MALWRWIGIAILPVVLVPFSLSAQGPPSPPDRGSFGLSESGPRTGTLVVRVRLASGVAPEAPAMVRLNAIAGGVELTEPTRENSEAIFRGLPMGVYQIEVTSPGFEKVRDEVEMWVPGTSTYAFIVLRAGSASTAASPPPGGPILAPKARQELEKGLEALRANDLKQAQKHLENAAKLAPNHPDVNYLLGILYLQLKDIVQAKLFLEKATQADPKHAAALTALGMLLFEQSDFAGSAQFLERALEQDTTAWKSHWAVATAYFHQGEHAKARAHAQQALLHGKEAASQVHLVLGQSLAALGEREEAIRELEKFLAAHATHPGANSARQLLGELRGPEAETQRQPAAAADAPADSPPVTIPDARPELPPRDWAPPDVDARPPGVSPQVRCSLSSVLEGVGRRARLLAENLQKFTANERIDHTDFNRSGYPAGTQNRSGEYLVNIRQTRERTLSVEESRTGPSLNSFPAPVTTGLPALALIFHPYYSDDFEITCEGLGNLEGEPAWLVHFRQRADRPSRVRVYHTAAGRFSIHLKGRAWVAANSHQILRLETDLVEPVRQARLEREHLMIDYAPVLFKSRNVELWLPIRADLYAHLGDRRFHHRHTFSDYMLFWVDVGQKFQTPEEP